jgi:exosortase A
MAAISSGQQIAGFHADWPRGFSASALVLLFVLAGHYTTAASLQSVWSDVAAYSHGYVVPLLAGWLLWRQRSRIESASLVRDVAGWAALSATSGAWLVAQSAELQLVSQLLLPLLAVATIWAAFGWPRARLIAPAMAYLYFAIPVWGLVNPLLRRVTALSAGWLASLAGFPVRVENTRISVPAGSFEVANGCSGTNFLVAALTVTVFLVMSRRASRGRKAFIVLGAAAAAVVANWIRVAILVMVGQYTAMQHPLVSEEHYNLGWVLFGLIFVGYLLLASRWLEPAPPPATSVIRDCRSTGGFAALAGALLLGTVVPVTWYALASQPAALSAAGLVQLPQPPAGWTGLQQVASGWRIDAPAADAFSSGAFVRSGAEVRMYRVAYLSESRHRELVSGDSPVGGAARLLEEGSLKLPEARGREVRRATYETPDGSTWLVWYVYRIGHREVSGPGSAKLALAMNRLQLRREPSRLLAIGARCARDCRLAQEQLVEFFLAGALDAQTAPPGGPTVGLRTSLERPTNAVAVKTDT